MLSLRAVDAGPWRQMLHDPHRASTHATVGRGYVRATLDGSMSQNAPSNRE